MEEIVSGRELKIRSVDYSLSEPSPADTRRLESRRTESSLTPQPVEI
jgi:hypothetical protein